MNWNFSTFFIWKIIKNVTDYETKLFYNTHFLSSFSDVLYQWKDPPPKKSVPPYQVHVIPRHTFGLSN